MKKLLVSFACILITLATYPQDSQTNIQNAYRQLVERGEIYFRFEMNSPGDVVDLTRMISIDNLKGNMVYAYANLKEFPGFLNYTQNFEILTPPSQLLQVKMTDSPLQVLDWNYYPTYTGYESLMTQFATDHPDICKLLTIGTLASGRKLLALKITDNPNIQEAEPEFLYTSTIHGDETTGYVLMLHLIDYLLQNYGVDQRITDMVNNTEIYINPLANPDGTYKGGNNSVNGATRGNANNVDLNRNYPDPAAGPHPDNNPWQPETVAFMNFAGFHHFTMSANFHGGEEVINYPWDTWQRITADDSWWIYVSREYADTVHLYAPSNYMNQFQNGITNGYAWYTITGGRQDYMNYFRNCREVTIEISDTKLLPANQLENHWNYNYRSFLNYIDQCNYGLHGIVTDSLTGEPLNCRVFITGHDMDSSHVFSDPQLGDYHRLLKAGTYDVTYSSAGYISKTIQVQITDRQKTTLDVQLYDGSLKSNFNSDFQYIAIGDSVHFFDLSAGNPVSWQWEFEGGTPTNSVDQNPCITYTNPGKYSVKLLVQRTGESDSLIREDFIEVKQGYLMGNSTHTLCEGLFLDSGGTLSVYAPNESSVITFIPGEVNKKIRATFVSFNLENSNSCVNDALSVYDGPDILSPLIGSFCGNDTPGTIIASGNQGSLTFEFMSNGSIQEQGWAALLQCDSNVGIEPESGSIATIFPNPVVGNKIHVISKNLIHKVTLFDLMGKMIGAYQSNTLETVIPAPSVAGVYVVQIHTSLGVSSQRILVTGNN